MAIARSKIDATSIVTSDTALSTKPVLVYWIAVTAGATGGAFQLNDSSNDSGTDKFSVVMPASTVAFFGPLDPPLQFKSGLFADVPGTNITLTIAHGK